jgi:hypothetical protein
VNEKRLTTMLLSLRKKKNLETCLAAFPTLDLEIVARRYPVDDDVIDVENQESDNESEQFSDFEENTQEREELNKLLHNVERRAFATNNGLPAVDTLPKSSPSSAHSTPNKSSRKRASPDRRSWAVKSLPNSLETSAQSPTKRGTELGLRTLHV